MPLAKVQVALCNSFDRSGPSCQFIAPANCKVAIIQIRPVPDLVIASDVLRLPKVSSSAYLPLTTPHLFSLPRRPNQLPRS